MASEVEQVLRARGPALSSAVADDLQKALGLQRSAARKRVERRAEPVRAVDLKFPRGEAFLYLPEHWGSSRFFTALGEALESGNGAFARAIWALRARGGVIPVAQFAAASANADVPGQVGASVVQERLVAAGVLAEVDLPGVGKCVGLVSAVGNDEVLTRLRSRQLAEQVLLRAAKEWARRLAFGSWDKFSIRGEPEPPKVGRFDWDLAAPSYLAPLVTWNPQTKKLKNGFVVFDVVLEVLDEHGVRPMVYKLDTMRAMRNLGRCMQFVVADGYTDGALRELRKRGIAPATAESLFGKDVALALRELISTLNQAAKGAVHPEKFEQLFQSLSKLEGAQGTLRGALFEFICADLARKALGAQQVVMNRLYRKDGRDIAEVDVRADCGADLYFVEAKGLLPGRMLDDQEVKDWLGRRIPHVFRESVGNSDFQGKRFKFELWTTGELSPEAKTMVAARKAELRDTTYDVDVRYGPELKSMATTTRDRSLQKVLAQHFFDHPLADAEPAAFPASASLPVPTLMPAAPGTALALFR